MNEKTDVHMFVWRLRPPYNVHVGFFYSYLEETKKINIQFLIEMIILFIKFWMMARSILMKIGNLY